MTTRETRARWAGRRPGSCATRSPAGALLGWWTICAAVAVSGCGIDRGGLGNGGLDAGPHVRDGGEDGGRSDAAPSLDAGRPVDAGSADDAGGATDGGDEDGGDPRDGGARSDASSGDAGGDAGPGDCRSDPTCPENGLGAYCDDPDGDRCVRGLACCTTEDCDTPVSPGVCTVTCTTDGDCPLDMNCEHGLCWFPCDDGECPHPVQQCRHSGRACEWSA